uniref:Uncharacterized protein n=1 Tax=Arundo donax TaxID=35708 RepID=A0A0A9GQU2_ARUDO
MHCSFNSTKIFSQIHKGNFTSERQHLYHYFQASY